MTFKKKKRIPINQEENGGGGATDPKFRRSTGLIFSPAPRSIVQPPSRLYYCYSWWVNPVDLFDSWGMMITLYAGQD